MIGGAPVHFGQVLRSFAFRNVFPLSLVAFAFALIVTIGAWLSGRFVARGIDRVTRRALAQSTRRRRKDRFRWMRSRSSFKPLVEA